MKILLYVTAKFKNGKKRIVGFNKHSTKISLNDFEDMNKNLKLSIAPCFNKFKVVRVILIINIDNGDNAVEISTDVHTAGEMYKVVKEMRTRIDNLISRYKDR